MIDLEFWDILSKVTVMSRDNGKKFTDESRINAINSLLWNSKYRRINSQGLFLLFSQKPVEEIKNPVVISTHIDCEEHITECFTRFEDDDYIRGTYDNAITNAAVIYNMLYGNLYDDVIVAFTGDEEENSKGAVQVVKYLNEKNITPHAVIVLDVTYCGWKEKMDFTIENNFWDNDFGGNIIDIAESLSDKWKFVPSDINNIPFYVSREKIIYMEAECDESWEYDEYGIKCFTLCLPVCGNMHSNDGVLARKKSVMNYVKILGDMLYEMSFTY